MIDSHRDARLDVVLDCIIFDLQAGGGVSRYWVNLIKGLCGLPSGPRLHLLINESSRSESAREVSALARSNPKMQLHPYRPRALERIRQPDIPRDLARRAVFHSSYYRTVRNMTNVVTVHDFTYEDVIGGWHAHAQHWQKSQAVARSAAVVCVSESTRRDFERRFPRYAKARPEVIYHGVEPHFALKKPPLDETPRTRDYVLFVGRRDEYKNFWCVAEALRQLDELHFMVVGPGLSRREMERLDARLPGRYTVRTQVDEPALVDLYRGAVALAYPSRYEGFGLPVLEAMACGCPVIALRASSIPEVAGNAALLLDDATAHAVAAALAHVRSARVREALIERGIAQAAGFSWSRAAAQYAALYAAASAA